MKKILSLLVVFILSINSAFAYNPTTQDTKLLELFYSKLDSIYEKNPTKIEDFYKKLSVILPQYKTDNKNKYYLTELNNYLGLKINGENKEETSYKVINIIDGDSIKIEYKGDIVSIRMIGIDAPENSKTRYGYIEEYGEEAKEALIEIIGEHNVQIELDETQGEYDKYDRLLAYVFIDGENINLKMIENGLAKEYTYNADYKYQKEFLTAENLAKSNKLNIWTLYSETESKNYKFYTSSYYSAHLYYCETDSDWEELSKNYLQEYDSEEELLEDSINIGKTLNRKCG